jgi:hypothetical protein
MSWSVGFEHDGYEDFAFAGDVTFRKGMRILRNLALTARDDSNMPEWIQVISDINDIYGDKGIMDDPDQWAFIFYGPGITFWIVKN